MGLHGRQMGQAEQLQVSDAGTAGCRGPCCVPACGTERRASQPAGMQVVQGCSGAAPPWRPSAGVQRGAELPFKVQQHTHGCAAGYGMLQQPLLSPLHSLVPAGTSHTCLTCPCLPAWPCRSAITCFRQSARRPHLAAVGLACGTCCTFNIITHKVGAQRQQCTLLPRRAGHPTAVHVAPDAAAASTLRRWQTATPAWLVPGCPPCYRAGRGQPGGVRGQFLL